MDRKSYTFSSEPRAVAARKKYRDPFAAPDVTQPTNLMWDKRVIRGNTYSVQPAPAPLDATSTRKRTTGSAKRKLDGSGKRSTTPDPVDGRKHMEIQTDQFLEELTDHVPESEVECQTDAFLDRPPSPLFVPKKSGIDMSTQIYEGDLFDFDFEVEPLLEVLVGKTLEQSMLEVMQEEELAEMRAAQREFEQKRNAELAETQRMEAAEKRRFEEKERRKAQEKARLEQEKKTKEKLAARTFAKSFLSNLQPAVFSKLQDQGYFYDVVEREVEADFMPWLINQMQGEIDKKRNVRSLVDDLIRAALKKSLQARRDAFARC